MKLVKACRTYQNADVEISKRANIIESIWYRISKQVEFLRDTCEELEPEFIRIQDGLLMSLVTELSVAAGKLESLSKINKRDKVKYVVVKPSLDVAISSLEAWQRRFDPAWYMTLKELKSTSNRIVDDHGSNAMETAKKVQIALSSGDPTGLTQLFLPLLKKAESTNIHDSTAMVLRDTARVNGLDAVQVDRHRVAQQAGQGLERQQGVVALLQQGQPGQSERGRGIQLQALQVAGDVDGHGRHHGQGAPL